MTNNGTTPAYDPQLRPIWPGDLVRHRRDRPGLEPMHVIEVREGWASLDIGEDEPEWARLEDLERVDPLAKRRARWEARSGRRERTEAALRAFLEAVGYTGPLHSEPKRPESDSPAAFVGLERTSLRPTETQGGGRCPGARDGRGGDGGAGGSVPRAENISPPGRCNFIAGDAVRHLQTGRLMEVQRLSIDPMDQTPRVHCRWSQDGEPCMGRFVPGSLERVLADEAGWAERDPDNLDRLGEELAAEIAREQESTIAYVIDNLRLSLKASGIVIAVRLDGDWVVVHDRPPGQPYAEMLQDAACAILAGSVEESATGAVEPVAPGQRPRDGNPGDSGNLGGKVPGTGTVNAVCQDAPLGPDDPIRLADEAERTPADVLLDLYSRVGEVGVRHRDGSCCLTLQLGPGRWAPDAYAPTLAGSARCLWSMLPPDVRARCRAAGAESPPPRPAPPGPFPQETRMASARDPEPIEAVKARLGRNLVAGKSSSGGFKAFKLGMVQILGAGDTEEAAIRALDAKLHGPSR